MEWWHFLLINFGIMYVILEVVIISCSRNDGVDFATFFQYNLQALLGCAAVALIMAAIVWVSYNTDCFGSCLVNWWLGFKYIWGIIGGLLCGVGGFFGLKHLLYKLFVKPAIKKKKKERGDR